MNTKAQILDYMKAQFGAKSAMDVRRALPDNVPAGTVGSALNWLTAAGQLRRVGRGLYEYADPAQRPMLPASTLQSFVPPPAEETPEAEAEQEREQAASQDGFGRARTDEPGGGVT